MIFRVIKGGHHRRQIVTVHALHVPAEGGPFFMQRLKAENFARIAVRLLFVHVNEVNQVSQAVVGRRHRRFPG